MDFPVQIVNGTKEVIIQIPYPFKDDFFQLLLTLLSVLFGFLFAIISIWITEKHKRKNVILASTKSLLNALKEYEKLLCERQKPTLSVFSIRNTRLIRFFHNGVIIPTGALDSIMYSGAFREFGIEEQNQISELYDEIKLVNDLDMKLFEFINMGDTGLEAFQENMWRHGSLLEDRYDIILNLISKLRNLLNNKKHNSLLARGNLDN